jgi:hypothetical protein
VTNVAKTDSRSRSPADQVSIRTSAYDKVSGLLISALLLLGTIVFLMFIVWLSSRLVFSQKSVPVKLVENVAGRGDHAAGFERDLEAPGMEEMPELAEPQIETSLAAVTEAVSTVAASQDVFDNPNTMTSRGEGGLGDSRPPGPLGEGDNIIPRWERWEVRWTATSLDSYSRQLDYFEVELAAIGGSQAIDYALHLSKARPDRRSGPPDKEKRLYMTWRRGTLEAFDKTLLARAGIAAEGRLILQFIPEKTEDQLARLEMQNGKGRNVKEFLKTVFGVQPTRDGFEFVVLDQRFRPAPP